MENNINTLEVGRTYKFDDIIQDSIMTKFGEMNVLKLVKGDTITEVVKAPRQLLTYLKNNPGITEFTCKKVIEDGVYKNYIFN